MESEGLKLISEARSKMFLLVEDPEKLQADGKLAMAAACYASPALIYTKIDGENVTFQNPWPWPAQTLDARRINGVLRGNSPFERSYDERLKQLAEAGAMIAMEIDRLVFRHKMQKDENFCGWCEVGHPAVPSSVSDAYVHTDTPEGRVVCKRKKAS